MKVALVYDRVNKWGGAERVLLALHELFPHAPLYTSVYNKESAPWASVFNIKTSFLQNFPFASTAHEYYPLLMPLAFESFNFDEFDLVISVTSEAAKGIITKPKTKHICYCLTPTRYLWSGYKDYFPSPISRAVASPFISSLRAWDKIAASRPDYYLAISNEVKKRIKEYYQRDSVIIYPPLSLESTENPTSTGPALDKVPYFLVVSRLVSYKRIDLVIKACRNLNLPLKIVGVGAEESKLRKMAGQSIEFLGILTDNELVRYYKNCLALIFPGAEDFGLTIVEAQSFGKPVIAYKKGGALEIIAEGKTGLFFSPQTVKALESALKGFDARKIDSLDCQKQVLKYSMSVFKRNFLYFINKGLKTKL